MDQESARRGLKEPSAFTTISLSKISSSTASVLALVVLKGIRVSHGAVMAMVTIFCSWPAVFSWAFPSAFASPPSAAVPAAVAAGALVSLGAEGAEQPDSAIIRHRARAVIFVERFLITISSFLIQAFAALIFNLLLQIYLMTILVSRASLAPSPRKLMQSTVISRARPGGNQSHGLWESTLMDWAS